SAGRRAGGAAHLAGDGAERARSAGRRDHVPLRRFVELAGAAGLGGDAPAARLGRTARLPRADELLGITRVFRLAADGAAAPRTLEAPRALAFRCGRRALPLDLVRRQRLAESPFARVPVPPWIRGLSKSDARAHAGDVLHGGDRRGIALASARPA